MIDNALKAGDLLAFGYFPDGKGRYAISEREAGKDQLRAVTSYTPWIKADVREMIPYESGKEVIGGVWRAKAEAMAAMQQ